MDMKLPCAVVRDLLPTYAEKLVEAETRTLVEAHLAACPDCRKRLSDLAEESHPMETAAPLQSLKNQLRRRRWRSAAMAALTVFILLFAYYFRRDSLSPLSWEEGLVTVEAAQGDALALRLDSRIVGVKTESVTAEDGSEILIMQGMGRKSRQAESISGEPGEWVLSPVPERVIYGYRQPQQLLWGEAMSGGVEVLPRLALGGYLLLAAAASAVLGGLWLFLRKPVLRQLFFAPLSYALAQLLLKGLTAFSFNLQGDLAMLLLAAAAIYGLLTLVWTEWRSRAE